jgi:hypothetical protein
VKQGITLSAVKSLIQLARAFQLLSHPILLGTSRERARISCMLKREEKFK